VNISRAVYLDNQHFYTICTALSYLSLLHQITNSQHSPFPQYACPHTPSVQNHVTHSTLPASCTVPQWPHFQPVGTPPLAPSLAFASCLCCKTNTLAFGSGSRLRFCGGDGFGEVFADEDADDDADEDGEADGEWMVRATTGMAFLCASMIQL